MATLDDSFATWSLEAGRNDDEKAKVEHFLQELRAASPQVYENLKTESEIPDHTWTAFFDYVTNLPASGGPIDHLVSFCRRPGIARCGRERCECQGALLGCLKTEAAVLRAMMHSAAGTALAGAAQSALNMALREESLDKQRGRLRGPITVPGWTVWAWFQPDVKSDPYSGIPRTRDLIRRLGLEIASDAPVLLWAHGAPNGECPRWPNAFDADANPLYRPGGKTFPISPSTAGDSDGLDEVVHSGITGADLAGIMTRLT